MNETTNYFRNPRILPVLYATEFYWYSRITPLWYHANFFLGIWNSLTPVLLPFYGLLYDEDVKSFRNYLYRLMDSSVPLYSGFHAVEYTMNRLAADPNDDFTDSEKAILDSVYYAAWYKLKQVRFSVFAYLFH